MRRAHATRACDDDAHAGVAADWVGTTVASRKEMWAMIIVSSKIEAENVKRKGKERKREEECTAAREKERESARQQGEGEEKPHEPPRAATSRRRRR